MKVAYEHIKQDESSSFYVGKFEDRNFIHSYHVHEECELIFIKEGRGRLVVGDYSGRFEAGELFLFGPNLPHAFFSDTGQTEAPQRVRSLYAQFKPDCFGERFFNLPEMKRTGKLLNESNRGIQFFGFDADKTAVLLESQQTTAPILRMARFIELLHVIITCPQTQDLATEQYLRAEVHHDSARLNRAIDFIHRKFTDQVTLDDVASAAHLSPAAFSRFFRKYMGQSFINYLIELRLSEACRLLLETDLSITEIAFSTGFRNLSNFNRQFLKRKQRSPRDFRKM